MHIEPATCPACGTPYDPLRTRAIAVLDGRVRAFCSTACRDRGTSPPPPSPGGESKPAAAAEAPREPRRRTLPADLKVLFGATSVALLAFVALIAAGRRARTAPVAATPAPAAASKPHVDVADVVRNHAWLHPLAGQRRRAAGREPRLFLGREGIPPAECGGARCAIDIEAAPGAVVMAVREGVVAEVERDRDRSRAQGPEGRYVRIVHDEGAIATTYWQLDGIREDLRPGSRVGVGEPIGTVARDDAHPHLRFGISVRGDDGAMMFINPVPLLALWPGRAHAPASLRGMERPRQE